MIMGKQFDERSKSNFSNNIAIIIFNNINIILRIPHMHVKFFADRSLLRKLYHSCTGLVIKVIIIMAELLAAATTKGLYALP
jgi:hypothetical protein